MREPGERLDAEDVRRRNRHDRLVMDLDFVVFECGAQPELEHAAPFGLHAQVIVENLDMGTPELLRPAHRDVRVAQELLGVTVATCRERDPDAGVKCRRASVREMEGLGDPP